MPRNLRRMGVLMRKFLLYSTAAVLAACLMTGCNNSASNQTTAAPQTTAAAPAATAAPTTAAPATEAPTTAAPETTAAETTAAPETEAKAAADASAAEKATDWTVEYNGSKAVLSLKSNHTTGFEWMVVGTSHEIIAYNSAYVPDPSPAGVTGVGGRDEIEITGEEAGEALLAMVYARNWAGGETAEVRNFLIDIADDLTLSNLREVEPEALAPYECKSDDAVTRAAVKFSMSDSYSCVPEAGMVMIPAPVIFRVEDTEDGLKKVYGNFWTYVYLKHGNVLENTAGGECPGVLYLKENNGEYEVDHFDAVGDGADYSKDIERICEGDKELEKAYYDFVEQEKAIRADSVREYVEETGIDVVSYKDFGWEAVEL